MAQGIGKYLSTAPDGVLVEELLSLLKALAEDEEPDVRTAAVQSLMAWMENPLPFALRRALLNDLLSCVRLLAASTYFGLVAPFELEEVKVNESAEGAHEVKQVCKSSLKTLVEMKADIEESTHWPPLFLAVGDVRRTRLWEFGWTPFMLAAYERDLTMIRRLLKQGVDREHTSSKACILGNCEFPEGSTALSIAKLMGHSAVGALLETPAQFYRPSVCAIP